MSILNYPPAPANPDDGVTCASVSFKKSVVNVALAMLLFILVYLLVLVAALALIVGVAFAGIKLVSAVHNLWLLILSLSLVLSSVMLFYFLIRFVFKKQERDYSSMIEVTEDDQPILYQFLRQLTTEAQSPFPKKVFLSAEVNAGVFYDTSFWNLFFPAKKNLQIGLGLVNSLNLSEFKAVMAHEFGHFSQRSMKMGAYSYNMNHVIYNLLFDNENYDDTMRVVKDLHWSISIGVSINLFLIKHIQNLMIRVYKTVNKAYMQLSREMEFNADAVAAYVAGSNHSINCLRRLEVADLCFNEMFVYLQTLTKDKKRPANIYPHHLTTMKFFSETHQLPLDEFGIPLLDKKITAINNTRINIEDQWASHPTLKDREYYLQKLNLSTPTINLSAWSIFHEPEKLQIALTNIVYANTSEKPDIIDDDIIHAAYIKFNTEHSLSNVYEGFYNGRLITFFDVDESVKQPAAASGLDSLLGEENYSIPSRINGLNTDIAILDHITANNEVKTFDFDGAKYDKNKAEEIRSLLAEEQNHLENDLKTLDEQIFRYFYHNSTQPESIISEYKEMFYQQEKAKSDINLYTEMVTAANRVFSTMTFNDIELVLNLIYQHEENLKPRLEELLNDPKYSSVVNPDNQKHLKMYLSKKWTYFTHPEYDEPSILVLTQALSAFYEIVTNKLFFSKKHLTDTQLFLLK